MIAWIAGNWAKPWKCLVDHDGVFDIRLMSYSSDIPGFSQAQNEAWTWVRTRRPRSASIPSIMSPTGACPYWWCTAAATIACRWIKGWVPTVRLSCATFPVELLYFPDENHWVLKPQNSVQWYATVEAWMKRWLGG